MMMYPGPYPRVETTAKWVWNLALKDSVTLPDTFPAALINSMGENAYIIIFFNFRAWESFGSCKGHKVNFFIGCQLTL